MTPSRSTHTAPDYQQWRAEQLRGLDDDYRAWREERQRRFADEFEQWRRRRQERGADSASSDTFNAA